MLKKPFGPSKHMIDQPTMTERLNNIFITHCCGLSDKLNNAWNNDLDSKLKLRIKTCHEYVQCCISLCVPFFFFAFQLCIPDWLQIFIEWVLVFIHALILSCFLFYFSLCWRVLGHDRGEILYWQKSKL